MLFAAAVRRDTRHRRARRIMEQLATQPTFTTDHVVLETWMLIQLRVGWRAAMDFLGALRGTPLAIETTTAADLERAETIDCTSFAVWRFGPGRKRALEILA